MRNYAAVVSKRCADKFGHSLAKHFDTVFSLPDDPLIDAPVADHPDMIMAIVEDELIVHSSYYKANKSIIDGIAEYGKLTVITTDQHRSAKYPADVGLNALIGGGYVFGRKDSLAPELIESAKRHGMSTLNVNQGYAACTSTFIDGAVYTNDPSIRAVAMSVGIPTFSSESIEIHLEGYDKGFIGGCSGAIGRTLFITGSLAQTKGSQELREILKNNCIEVVELGDFPLEDFGGIKVISPDNP